MKKKFTMLFAALLACVGVAKADVTDLPQITTDLENPIYYTIYNTRSDSPGGLIYYAGDDAGIKDGCTSLTLEDKYQFFFTGSHDAMYIHNKATNKKMASVTSWTDEGIQWTVSAPTDKGLAFGPKGGTGNVFWNEQNQGRDGYTTWSATDEGSIFVVELAENFVAPNSGLFYVIEAPLFEKAQGVKKALYVNGENAVWGTEDLTNHNFYWIPTVKADGTIALQNFGTGKYLSNATGAMSEEAVYGNLNALGSNSFNINFSGNIHAEGHSSGQGANGNLVSWNGTVGSASAWTFVQRNDPTALQEVVVKYSFTYGGTERYTQEVNTLVGEEWPAITVSFPYGVSSATKPAGEVTAEGAVEGVVTKTIELAVNLPFTYASDYASIENWYYININTAGYYLNYKEGAESMDLTATAVPADQKDAYTWAFIGNPFDGYQIVNKAAGESMILSSSTTMAGNNGSGTYPIMTNTPVTEGHNTLWFATASTHRTNGFYLEQSGFSANKMNRRDEKLAYWTTGKDAGSTFMVELRPIGPVAELAALIEEIEAAGIVCGTNPGEYTEASVNDLNEAVAAAKTVGSSATESDLSNLQAAYDALVVNPITAGMYRIVSAYSEFSEQKGITCYAQDGHYRNRTNPGWAAVNENDPLQYWVLEDAGNGTFNLKAAYEGNYITTATSMSEVAKAATFTLLGKAQFNITLAGDGDPLHCNGWNWQNTTQAALTTWGGGVDSPSAWKLVTVSEEPEFTLDLAVGEVGYATLMLAYNATIPTGATCYTAAVDGEYVKLTEVEGNVLPAKTPVIVAAEADTYSFVSTTATAVVSAENELVGSLYPQIVTPDANTTCYVLAKPAAEEGEEENPVGFYKAALNQSGNAAFLNNANKVYLPVAAGAEAPAMFSFGRGEGTTGIETAVSGEQTVVIYDLAGRRVEKMEKGIYIVNGKKVVK